MAVDEQFARDEGEDDGSLDMYRRGARWVLSCYQRQKEHEVWSMESARVLCEGFETV